MKRLFTATAIFLSLCAFVVSNALAVGVAPSKLIAEADANAVGLTRAWFAQATLNRDIEEVQSATVQDGVLFLTTTDGFLQAFDAEKGTALWTISVGDEYLLPPAVNSRVVAVVCGTRLVIYDRFSGDKLTETEVYGQPSSGPVLSERECYVPIFSEKILAYPLVRAKQEQLQVNATIANMSAVVKDNKTVGAEMADKFAGVAQDIDSSFALEPLGQERPFVTATFGVSMTTPVMGSQSYELDVVSWTTEKGWILFAEMERNVGDTPFKLLYKLQDRPNFAYINERRLGNRALIPRSDVEATPYYVPEDRSIQNMRLAPERRKGGMFIVGSMSGHVFAMNDVSGLLRWTYLTEKPISERIAAFGDYAFIPTDNGDYFAIALRDGKEAWRATEIKRTVASSASRLYTIDTLNRLAIIDRETGARVKTLDIGNTKFQVFNQWTDRVYVVTADGLIQCLHETQQVEPLRHRESCQMINDRIIAGLNKDRGVAKSDESTKSESASKPVDEADDEDDPFGASDSGASSNAAAAADAEEAEDDPFGGDSSDDPFGDGSSSEKSGTTAPNGNEEDDPFAGEEEEDPFS